MSVPTDSGRMEFGMGQDGLYELKERLETAAIAGSAWIEEDFRLKKAVEQIEPLANSVPVLKRIVQMVKKIQTPGCEVREELLLEGIALLNAVLITQGVCQVDGDLEEIEASGTGKFLDMTYCEMHPILCALKETGGGRHRILEEAYRDHPQFFGDYRIKSAMVQDLGDSYSEIAQMLKEWLIAEKDLSTVGLLKQDFWKAGKKGMAARIEVMEKIAGASENDFYRAVYPEAPKEVKEPLIHALEHDPGNDEFLIEIARTEKGILRELAYEALARCGSEKACQFLTPLVQKKGDQIIQCLSCGDAAWISDLVAEQFEHLFDKICSGAFLDAKEEEKQKAAMQMELLLQASVGKTSEKMQRVYRRAMEMPEDTAREFCKMFQTRRAIMSEKAGTIRQIFANLLTETILFATSNEEEMGKLAEEFHESYGEEFLGAVFAFDLLQREKEEMYEMYREYFHPDHLPEQKIGEKDSDIFEKNEKCVDLILGVFEKIVQDNDFQYRLIPDLFLSGGILEEARKRMLTHGISRRWYELLLEYGKKARKTAKREQWERIMRILCQLMAAELALEESDSSDETESYIRLWWRHRSIEEGNGKAWRR